MGRSNNDGTDMDIGSSTCNVMADKDGTDHSRRAGHDGQRRDGTA